MHDKNGKLISVGDTVRLVGKVTNCATGDGSFCSVQVELEGDWDGKGNLGSTWCSAKQVEVVE